MGACTVGMNGCHSQWDNAFAPGANSKDGHNFSACAPPHSRTSGPLIDFSPWYAICMLGRFSPIFPDRAVHLLTLLKEWQNSQSCLQCLSSGGPQGQLEGIANICTRRQGGKKNSLLLILSKQLLALWSVVLSCTNSKSLKINGQQSLLYKQFF